MRASSTPGDDKLNFGDSNGVPGAPLLEEPSSSTLAPTSNLSHAQQHRGQRGLHFLSAIENDFARDIQEVRGNKPVVQFLRGHLGPKWAALVPPQSLFERDVQVEHVALAGCDCTSSRSIGP